MVKIVEYVEGGIVYHPVLGQSFLVCAYRNKVEDTMYYGVVPSLDVPAENVRADKADNFTVSCLSFKKGQAIKYNSNIYRVTSLEVEGNLIVAAYICKNNTIRKSERFALIPSKCAVVKHSQLRVVIVNELNEIVEEVGAYE